MDGIFSNKNIIYLFTKRWKPLIIITFLGTVVSGAATFLVKPKYEATAMVYPTNLGGYSEESYTEQMIQLLHSRDIADSVIKKLDLTNHYKLKPTDKNIKTKLYNYYNDFITIRKTIYESVEISVLDTDPELACDIVNAILYYYNQKVLSIHSLKIAELIELDNKYIEYWEAEILKTREILAQILSNAGVKDFAKTMEKLNTGEIEYSVKRDHRNNIDIINKTNNQRSINTMNKINNNSKLMSKDQSVDFSNAKNLGPYYTEYARLYSDQIAEHTYFKIEKENLEVEYAKDITYYVSVSSPYAPDEKTLPKRIPIALLGGLASLLVSFIAFGAFEQKIFLKRK